MLDQLLAPLDYPRQALYGLGQTGYRTLTGQVSLEDILGALPGVAGLGATALAGPGMGALVGGAAQGLGRLSGLRAFDAPTASHLLEALGADPESPYTQFGAGALHVATDPLMMMGLLKGGNALAGMGGAAEEAQALKGGLGGRASLPPMLSPMGEVPTGAPPTNALAQMLTSQPEEMLSMPSGVPTPSDLFWNSGRRVADVAPPQANPIQAMLEAEGGLPGVPRELPGVPGVPDMSAPGSLRPHESYLLQSQQQYPGNVGMLRDQMTDVFAKGYATPEERIAASQATNDHLLQAKMLRDTQGSVLAEKLGGVGLPPLSPQEVQMLQMREAMDRVEGAAGNFHMNPRTSTGGALLEDAMAVPAADRISYAGAPSQFERLLQRELPSVDWDTAPISQAEMLAHHPEAYYTEQAQHLAKMMADAKLASPELQMAQRQAQQMEALLEGRLPPQQTAALIEELRRFGVPIEPESAYSTYVTNMENGSLDDMAAHFTHRATPGWNPARLGGEQFQPLYGDPNTEEAMLTQSANTLLQMMGPQRMQELAGLDDPGRAYARIGTQMYPQLVRELERALTQRGLMSPTVAGTPGLNPDLPPWVQGRRPDWQGLPWD